MIVISLISYASRAIPRFFNSAFNSSARLDKPKIFEVRLECGFAPGLRSAVCLLVDPEKIHISSDGYPETPVNPPDSTGRRTGTRGCASAGFSRYL